MDRVIVLTLVALVWLAVNLKAKDRWLRFLSLCGLIVFLVAASAVALDVAGVPAP